jgi:hypothetical protein
MNVAMEQNRMQRIKPLDFLAEKMSTSAINLKIRPTRTIFVSIPFSLNFFVLYLGVVLAAGASVHPARKMFKTRHLFDEKIRALENYSPLLAEDHYLALTQALQNDPLFRAFSFCCRNLG